MLYILYRYNDLCYMDSVWTLKKNEIVKKMYLKECIANVIISNSQSINV